MADQRIQSSEEMVGAGHASKSDTLNRLTLIEHTTEGFHKLYEEVPITASMMIPCESTPPSTGTIEHTSNDVNLDYLAFAPSSVQQANFGFQAPPWWDTSTLKAKFHWSPASGGGSAEGESVTWSIRVQAMGHGDDLDGSFGSHALATTDVLSGTSDLMHVSSATPAISVNGSPAVGDWLQCRVLRAINSGDDMAGDAWLLGVTLQFYRDEQVSAW